MSARRSLVIGGLGFIGVNLAERLLTAGDEVTLVTPNRARHEARAAAFADRGAHIVEGDLRDRDAMAKAVAGQHLVFNLAGESGAVRSMEDPWTDLDVNCMGNLSLLEALRTANRDARLVFVGSRLQYGKQDQQPVGEDQEPDPLCLHAIHKLTVERYLRLYGTLYGIKYTIARVTNPYGPGQPESRTAYGIVNRLIHLALAGKPLTVYGDGAQRRDYIYVDDLVTALVMLAESPVSAGRAYNVGSGTGTRLIDMARTVIEIAGGGRVEHVDWPALAGQIETGDFIADISRIERELGWRPAIGLRDGLERTVALSRGQVQA
ncbi:MAG: NAD-dependent epimerase/dehydratase family protein [Acidobacteriota bacterium]|nr:NAD-dependent epimerase/dehydratase family protein [Acidobacteriota bacterium]